MREIKVKYAAFIAVLVFAILSVAAAITFWALPADILDAKDGQIIKIIFGSFFSVFGVLFLFVSFSSLKKEKQRVAYINNLIASSSENALIFEGKEIDKESARENAKKTAASVAIASVFALIFGFGVYKVSGNGTPYRLFLISDEGMTVIHPQTLSPYTYNREYKKDMVLTEEKNGQIKVHFSEITDFYYLINTKNTDVDQAWLINRLNELFKQHTVKPAQSPFEEI